MFLVFDLLWQDGVDLRGLPLSERKRDLDRLCRKSKVPFMRQVQTFPDGPLLFEQLQQVRIRGCRQQALERRATQAGRAANGSKTKCPGWKRVNAERWRIFEGPRKPELTEAQKTLAKKREELARVLERLQSPGLTPGIGARAAQARRLAGAGNRGIGAGLNRPY